MGRKGQVPRCPRCNGLGKRMSIRRNPGARFKMTRYFYCESCQYAFIPNDNLTITYRYGEPSKQDNIKKISPNETLQKPKV